GDDADVGADAVFADRHFRDPRAVDQRGLDLERRHAMAAGIHDVVGAAMRPEIAIVIEGGEVAAGKPVAAEGARLLLRAAPIAEHQSRVAAMDGEEADLAGRERFGRAGGRYDGDGPAALGL